MTRSRNPIEHIAHLLLRGPWSRASLINRATKALGPRIRRRAKRLIDEVFASHSASYPPPPHALTKTLGGVQALANLSEQMVERILDAQAPRPRARFLPTPALTGAAVPKLLTEAGLAYWLDLPLDHLDWFADERRTQASAPSATLHHYDYHWRQKRNGGWRLIEAPRPRLKHVQRRILDGILNHLPAHDAAYGFVPGRSCANAAAKHAGEYVVITADLRDFFLMTPLSRVYAVFRCLGYPHNIARKLTSLCSTETPGVIATRHFDHTATIRHRTRHLPQGAPTSPALANLAALGLDRRLTGLARKFDARYTRYADDMTFSGDLQACANTLLAAIATIVRDEGYVLNAAKTRVMPRHTRQTVTGIVVNNHINLARPEFDRLKATLTNCLRHGTASQNRDNHPDFRAHLDGRIAWAERLNLRRGEKLRRLFDAIAW